MLQELETQVSKGFLSGATQEDLSIRHIPSKPEARACAGFAGRAAVSCAPGFTSGSWGSALHAPAGVAPAWWVLVVLAVPASQEPVGQQVSPRGRTKKGVGRRPAWSLPPPVGCMRRRGRRADGVPGSLEARAVVFPSLLSSNLWLSSSELSLRERASPDTCYNCAIVILICIHYGLRSDGPSSRAGEVGFAAFAFRGGDHSLRCFFWPLVGTGPPVPRGPPSRPGFRGSLRSGVVCGRGKSHRRDSGSLDSRF